MICVLVLYHKYYVLMRISIFALSFLAILASVMLANCKVVRR